MPIMLDQSTYVWDKDDEEEDVLLYDITTISGDSAYINGAYFFSAQPITSAGTGVIQAFVRVQDGGNDDTPGVEDGYNTDARPLLHEENSSPSFTTNLSLADVPVITLDDGNTYYEFRLDINQLNSSQYLSLDELYVMVGGTSMDVTGLFDANGDGIVDQSFLDANGLTVVYDLDEFGNNSVLLDYSLQAGSGKSDMFFYVPTSSFSADQNANPEDYNITLYSKFGELGELDQLDGTITAQDDAVDVNGDGTIDGNNADDNANDFYLDYSSNDGFEEWSVSKVFPGVDFTGYKWHDLNGNGLWDDGEGALSGWQINYTIEYTITYKGNQTNNPPETVIETFSVVTDENGQYTLTIPTFTNNDIANVEYTLTIYETLIGGWGNTYGGYYDSPNDLIVDPTVLNFNDGDIDGSGSDIDTNGDEGVAEALNFGNYQYGSIEGTKVEDLDGIEGGDSTPVENWNIYLFNSDPGDDPDLGTAYRSTMTDANGDYSFGDLPPGNYWVVEESRDGWFNVTAVEVEVGTQTSGFDVDDVDFANTRYGSIEGTKVEDLDGIEGGDSTPVEN
ncbi:carboxypeptidase-like regulatory domain-containing protein, partial [Qipengyuania sphaerica]|uniref:carboxypeptidase-like regulatory domain-containing protein n=1 Tax=Qipengyuania sphaerica TaxID=2867243 RepID=UPI001C8704F4